MDPDLRKALEAAGYVFGDAADFLDLTEAERFAVDRWLALRREQDAKLQQAADDGPSELLTRDEWESMRREALAGLDAEIRAGLESGPSTPMTREDWDSIEREAMELFRKRREGGGPA